MRSKAHIKGHSIHRILVIFPITFFTSAFVADLVYLVCGSAFANETACWTEAAGLLCGAGAALPGAIDYFFTVPPVSSARKRATTHALLNILMLLIFSGALVLRKQDPSLNPALICMLEGLGIAVMCISGWHGSTLVSRNQIGIDHRYANAGRWKEEKIVVNSGRAELTGLGQLKLNQMKLFHIAGKRVVVGLTEEGYQAFDDFCTHRGGSLADGSLICSIVQCPWHGSQFSVKDGSVKAGPAKEKISVYTIEEADGKYYIRIADKRAS